MGWPIPVRVQPVIKAIILHGRRWEAMNMNRAPKKAKRKRVEDRASLEKLVCGFKTDIIWS